VSDQGPRYSMTSPEVTRGSTQVQKVSCTADISAVASPRDRSGGHEADTGVEEPGHRSGADRSRHCLVVIFSIGAAGRESWSATVGLSSEKAMYMHHVCMSWQLDAFPGRLGNAWSGSTAASNCGTSAFDRSRTDRAIGARGAGGSERSLSGGRKSDAYSIDAAHDPR
jgi:hypothetical protein